LHHLAVEQGRPVTVTVVTAAPEAPTAAGGILLERRRKGVPVLDGVHRLHPDRRPSKPVGPRWISSDAADCGSSRSAV